MPGSSPNAQRLEKVEAVFRSLPERFLGADPGFDATFQIRLADVGHVWEVRVTEHAARVRKGVSNRRPDVVISSDSQTWLELYNGALSGIDAFSQRRLAARGKIDLATAFEGLFRLAGGRAPLLRTRGVASRGSRVSVLTMGTGRDVVLIHGLGATKSSFFDTAAALSRRYRVHAIDLPGFGSSSKPLNAPYSAKWFADQVLGVLDGLEIPRAHIVGNSLGGRVAIEIGLTAPERVHGLGLLCPATAFVRRDLHPLVRVLRPEFGVLPHRFARRMVENQFWGIFGDRDAIDPVVAEVGIDEFQRIYNSPRARLAFLTAARNIYLETPFGRNGFYPRLAELTPPALFVWATEDRLVPAGFSRIVEEWLPGAEQITLQGCGHAPQIERPEQTNGLLERFFARVDALAPSAAHVAA